MTPTFHSLQQLRRLFAALAVLAASLLAAGCASTDIQAYADQKPAFDLRRYFDGTLEGHGMVLDRGGQVTRRFVVVIKATWAGDVGTLDEDFTWSDGERERRVWTLRPGAAPGQWTGTAADVKGNAEGAIAGNALRWKYTYLLKTKSGRTWEIDFDDWMYLVDERVLLNRATMSFWGLRVGEILISFRRP